LASCAGETWSTNIPQITRAMFSTLGLSAANAAVEMNEAASLVPLPEGVPGERLNLHVGFHSGPVILELSIEEARVSLEAIGALRPEWVQ